MLYDDWAGITKVSMDDPIDERLPHRDIGVILDEELLPPG